MNSTILKFLKIVLPLGLGLFLIYSSYNSFTPEELNLIKTEILQANYSFVIIGLFASILSHFSRAWRWNYMLTELGYKPTFLTNITSIGVGYAMNLLIPRSGELSRAVIVNRTDKIPVDKAFGTIVAERVLDLIILLAIVLLAFLLSGEQLFYFFKDRLHYAFAKANSQQNLIILMIIVFVIIAISLVWKFLKPFKKINSFIQGLKEGFNTIWTMKKKWAYFLHTLFIWVMYVFMFWINIYALESTVNLPFHAVLCAFVAGSFAVAFTNGGFGAYPYLVAQVLLLFGLDETAGTSFGWIIWSSQTLLVLAYALVSFIILSVKNTKSDN